PGPLRHDNFGVPYFIEMMTIMENGVFGAPLEVAATYAFLFVLFGSFYEKAGGGQLFFELARAVTGRMRGGAAKACVTASGLYGSISGSPTADVATTGPLTIPIMKKMGVPAARAGAIEATASSGGAMLPPVMGAVAFIMSDITGIAYASIAWASVLPALLYYYAIYLLVHNEAVRHNEPRLPEDQIVPLGRALKNGWRHLLPLGALIGLLVAGYTPVDVAAGAIAGVNPMSLGPYAVKLAIGGFILPFYFLFNPGLNMQGDVLYILECVAFAIAMCTFASYAMQGYLGLRLIAWPLRLLLMGCAIATI